MEDKTFKIQIASPPDRTKLVAMIIYRDEQWAEINQESETMTLEIYPKREGGPWVLDLEIALEWLQNAREQLKRRCEP